MCSAKRSKLGEIGCRCELKMAFTALSCTSITYIHEHLCTTHWHFSSKFISFDYSASLWNRMINLILYDWCPFFQPDLNKLEKLCVHMFFCSFFFNFVQILLISRHQSYRFKFFMQFHLFCDRCHPWGWSRTAVLGLVDE